MQTRFLKFNKRAKYYFDVLGKKFISQISFFFISFLFFCHDTKEPT